MYIFVLTNSHYESLSEWWQSCLPKFLIPPNPPIISFHLIHTFFIPLNPFLVATILFLIPPNPYFVSSAQRSYFSNVNFKPWRGNTPLDQTAGHNRWGGGGVHRRLWPNRWANRCGCHYPYTIKLHTQ